MTTAKTTTKTITIQMAITTIMLKTNKSTMTMVLMSNTGNKTQLITSMISPRITKVTQILQLTTLPFISKQSPKSPTTTTKNKKNLRNKQRLQQLP